ncbi:MAG: PIN domain-containing protein [bacterium]
MTPVLVDTAIWIQYLRKGDDAASERLIELLENERVCVNGIIIAELFSGAKSEKDKKLLRNILIPIPYLTTTRVIWRQSGELKLLLLTKGHSIPLPDAIIAATAVHYGVELFSMDIHFSVIAKYIPLKLIQKD